MGETAPAVNCSNMGGSGKNLIGHGARRKYNSPPAQPKDGGYGLPPHPLTVRTGQRYFPRVGRRRAPLRVARVNPNAGVATLRSLAVEGTVVNAKLARLLAVRGDGQGRHYQHVGFVPGRYRTYAVVVDLPGRGAATLVLPEWHPSRPVSLPARLLPIDAQCGDWLSCTADLSQGRAAWLNIAELTPTADPGPESCHRVRYVAPVNLEPDERPKSGPRCGDLVIRARDLPALPDAAQDAMIDVFVRERADLDPGARIYIASGEHVHAYIELLATKPLPAGLVLRCRAASKTLPRPIPCDTQPGPHHWIWRWWDRAAEG